MKEPKVIISIKSGMVAKVCSNVHDLEVIVLDYDNVNEWTDEERHVESIVKFTDEQERLMNDSLDFTIVY